MTTPPPPQSPPGAPPPSPIEPIELTLDSPLQFHCHKGIACFNACCRDIDITLLPYDILRLKRRAAMTSAEWVARYTMPFPMDGHNMPGLKMATKPGTRECVFLEESGCSVYSDRPSACRYYALGAMGMRRQGSAETSDLYFLVKEAHCLGHNEPHTTTVREYRRDQELEEYDSMNRPWRDLVLKKRSAGPAVGKPSTRSMQLFDMCSYDMDNFRRFIDSDGFTEVFEVDAAERAALDADEDKLLQFAYRFLGQVLFGEHTIAVKADAQARRMQRRKERTSQTPSEGE